MVEIFFPGSEEAKGDRKAAEDKDGLELITSWFLSSS
jgi:hypothetical protein